METYKYMFVHVIHTLGQFLLQLLYV